jgi:glutaminyl-tRNA synthetase
MSCLLVTLKDYPIEPSLTGAVPGNGHQFIRQESFCVEPLDFMEKNLIFNRTISLKGDWPETIKE